MKPSVTLVPTLRGVAGFLVLLGFLQLGRLAHDAGHVPLPATVLGLGLIAAALVAVEWRSSPAARTAGTVLVPPARLLISHLGLLFIPAGVGIMTQSALLRSQWLPIVAALFGSTWVGIAVTGWVMQRLTRAP